MSTLFPIRSNDPVVSVISKKMPKLEEFIGNSDFVGAKTLLQFQLASIDDSSFADIDSNAIATVEMKGKLLEWLAWCSFHNSEYQGSLETYDKLLVLHEEGYKHELLHEDMINLFRATCMYFLNDYDKAEQAAMRCPDSALKIRLLYHIALKQRNDDKLTHYHRMLLDGHWCRQATQRHLADKATLTSEEKEAFISLEQKKCELSTAAMKFDRGNYQEAMETYKEVLQNNRDDTALHFYIAMCHYMLDYYDFSREVLQSYTQSRGESPLTVNLKACNQYKLFNGKVAESEFRPVVDNGNLESNTSVGAILRHNKVVFRNGEVAPSTLTPLLKTISEARLNLLVYYIRSNALTKVAELMNDFNPMQPVEMIIAATVHAVLGRNIQLNGNMTPPPGWTPSSGKNIYKMSANEHFQTAEEYYTLVGNSPSEKDTIPGRQASASAFFLQKQFHEASIYLSSIGQYMINEDEFAWNYGITLAAIGKYEEAEEVLLNVTNPEYQTEYVFTAALVRCLIMNGRATLAWDHYLRLDTGEDSLKLLKLIANDCYKTGAFLVAAKAFNVLERLHPNEVTYWEGKRGSCAGVLQSVLSGDENKDSIHEVIPILRSSISEGSNPAVAAEAEALLRIFSRWLQSNEDQ